MHVALLAAAASSTIRIVLAAPTADVSITKRTEPVDPVSYISFKEGFSRDSFIAKLFSSTPDSDEYYGHSPSSVLNLIDSGLHAAQGLNEVKSRSSDTPREAKPASEPMSYLSKRDKSPGDGVDIYVIGSGINIASRCFREGQAEWGRTFGQFRDGHRHQDDMGSGTHAACIVAQIATHAKIFAVKVPVDTEGWLTAKHAVQAINWVGESAGRWARSSIILYAGVGVQDQTLDSAVPHATMLGIHFVAMAGDLGVEASHYSPGRSPHSITVSAIDWEDNLWSEANYGSSVSILAPGGTIQGSWNPQTTNSGTLSAAARVTGILAIAISKHGDKPPSELKRELFDAARRLPQSVQDDTTTLVAHGW